MSKLGALYAHEEAVRRRATDLIGREPDLADHIALIEASMDAIYACVAGPPHRGDDDLTLQLLGIRLFNSAAASLKLGLSGYYQAASHHIRDLLETGYLIDYFSMKPERIAVWRQAGTKARIRDFGPYEIRRTLDRRDGGEGETRAEAYELLSEMSSHVTDRGFRLIARDGLGEIGAFFDPVQLRAWLEELTKRILEVARLYSRFLSGRLGGLGPALAGFDEAVEAWRSRYATRADHSHPAGDGAPA